MPGAKYLANSFSLGMLSKLPAVVKIEEVPKEVFCREIRNAISVIGHEGTAQIITNLCSVPVTVNRSAVQLNKGDIVYVFQLITRLPEGKILSMQEIEELILQNKVKFMRVEVIE